MNFNRPPRKNSKPFYDRKLQKKSRSMPELKRSTKGKYKEKYNNKNKVDYKDYGKKRNTQEFNKKGGFRRQNSGYKSYNDSNQREILPSFFKSRPPLNYGLSKEEMEIHAILDEEDRRIRQSRRKRVAMTTTTNLRKRNIQEFMDHNNPFSDFDEDDDSLEESESVSDEPKKDLRMMNRVVGELKKVKKEDEKQQDLSHIPLGTKKVRKEDEKQQDLSHIPLEKEKEEPKETPLSTEKNEKKSAPWMSDSTGSIDNTLIRFHNEIIDFVGFIGPSDTENNSRKISFEKLEKLIKSHIPRASVKPFGSYVTSLYLPQSDIDVAVIETSMSNHTLINKLAKVLMRHPAYDSVSVIKYAKVPLVKVVEKSTGINFDISFNKLDGVYQVQEIQKALDYYPEMKYLILVIKCFLKQRDFNETYQGGIGSFLLFCLVLAFLREVKRDYDDNKKDGEADKVLLSEYVLKFLDFYANFDISRDQILVAGGGGIVQKYYRTENFSVLSPQDVSHDIGSAAYRIREVFGIFKNRYNFVINYSFKKGESVLKYLIAGERI